MNTLRTFEIIPGRWYYLRNSLGDVERIRVMAKSTSNGFHVVKRVGIGLKHEPDTEIVAEAPPPWWARIFGWRAK